MNRIATLAHLTALTGAALFAAVTAANAAGSCSTGFVVVPSPSVSATNDSNLSSVAGRTSRDVWAVGQYAPDANPNITLTLAEHFDGTAWSIVRTPNVGTQGNALLRVAALANGQAWAVGYRIDDGSFWSRSLIEHWNGREWEVSEHPSVGESSQLFGVAARAPNDVWAVGSYQHPLGVLHTLVEHFDGANWTVVPSPDPGTTGNQLYAVVAPAADLVFAVGTEVDFGEAQPLVLTWDGTRWTRTRVARDPLENRGLYGIAAENAGEVLAVGETENESPGVGTSGLALGAATGLPWNALTVTHVGSGDNHFYDVATSATGAAWAVGGRFDVASGTVRTLIEALDDGRTTWNPVPSPSPNATDDNILGGVAVVGSDVWAVGVAPNQNARQTLILRRCLGG